MITNCQSLRQQYYMYLADSQYICYCTYQPTVNEINTESKPTPTDPNVTAEATPV
jgi:hypothetical protein